MDIQSVVAKLQPAVKQAVESKKEQIISESPVVVRLALKLCWGFLTSTLLPLVVKLSVHVAVAYVIPWIIGLLQVLVASTDASKAKNANKLMLDLVEAMQFAPSELDRDVVAVLRSTGVVIPDTASAPSIDGMEYWKN